jgi:hypothetical protein
MTVITLTDFSPPPRFDGLPFTQARIEEAATASGTFTAIETFALDPVDADPESPASRSFTTEDATLDDGWYRVVFIDANGDESQPSDPVHSGGGAYFTVAEFRARYPQMTEALYPDAQVAEMRELAEEAIEDSCGVAFKPRAVSETVTAQKAGDLNLGQWPAREITSITVNGDALTAADYGIVDGRIYPQVPFTAASTGLSTIVVEYTHGYDSPPARIKLAAMILTFHYLNAGPLNDRGLRELVAAGDFADTVPLANWPREVEAAVAQYRMPSIA